MFLITNDDDLWVTAEVDEEDRSLVHPGQEVEVAAEALSQPLPGRVAHVGPVAVSRGLAQVRAKIVRCKVVLDRGQELLKPGMEVDISAMATLAEGALLAPAGAVAESDDGPSVLVVANGVVRRQRVEIGHSNYREVEITSGLDEGDLVVVSDDRELRDGQRVAVHRE